MASSRASRRVAVKRLNVLLMVDVTGRGGAEKVLVDIATRLNRSRYHVTVCATRWAGNYQHLLDQAGVPTVILDRRTLLEAYKFAKLVRLLRRQPVHILHTHLFGANTWGRILGKLARVPVIIAHEHWSSKASKEVWVDRLLYRLSDSIIVPSEASKRAVMGMEAIPARNLRVIYNGVDTALFRPSSEASLTRGELGIMDGAVVVGTVGRLSPEKGGVDILVKSVADLRRKHPNLALLVVGDGPLKDGLEELANRMGAGAVFTGTRDDVARLLGAMDIFVLPSLREALPLALLEAMSTRLPVVATHVGGIPEVLRHGVTGLLVPPNDQAALSKALENLIVDRNMRLGLGVRAQDHVHTNFAVEGMVRNVEELYERLAARKLRLRN